MVGTQTFKEAYGVLQRHAETLRKQTEPGIDDLLHIVEESVGAYKVCKERIDAVEKALQKALVDVGDGPEANNFSESTRSAKASSPSSVTASTAKPRATGFDDMGDDDPF